MPDRGQRSGNASQIELFGEFFSACRRDWAARSGILLAVSSWSALVIYWLRPSFASLLIYTSLNLLILGATAVLLGVGISRIKHPEERRFWGLMALSFGVWFAARSLWLSVGGYGWSSNLDFATDVMYLLSFLGMFMALGAMPHLAPGWSKANRLYYLGSLGRVIFAIGLVAYFVALPHLKEGGSAQTRHLSFVLYSALDLLLLTAVIHNVLICRSRAPVCV
jgi:hypothetical protein